MPKAEKRRQRKLLKKRRRAKQHKQKQTVSLAPTVPTLLRRAREFAIHECLINPDWDKDAGEGFARILLSRRQPDGMILFGTYLVDIYCLGLKDTFGNANFTPGEYQREILPIMYFDMKPEPCPIELAHQLIYQGIDYAARFGFKPNKDYKWS